MKHYEKILLKRCWNHRFSLHCYLFVVHFQLSPQTRLPINLYANFFLGHFNFFVLVFFTNLHYCAFLENWIDYQSIFNLLSFCKFAKMPFDFIILFDFFFVTISFFSIFGCTFFGPIHKILKFQWNNIGQN